MNGIRQKILVRGVNWLGDAVMTTPALLRLREHFPSAEIAILTPEKLGPLYLHHPAVDRVLMFSPRDSLVTISAWLRAEQFDCGIVFPNSPRSAMEMFLGRVRRRVGYARPWRTSLLTQRIPERADVAKMHKRSRAEVSEQIAAEAKRDTFDVAGHHIHHYLRLVAALGCNPAPIPPRLHLIEDEMREFSKRFAMPQGQRLFGLNAGAEYGAAKRWPEERFIEAAVQLHRRTGCTWLVLGGRADSELAQRISRQITTAIGPQHLRNIVGETSLRELCAALKQCLLVLTNDTGPMHVAAAVGTPVVVPFGSTSPELTGPGLPGDPRHRLLAGSAPCAPCFLRECPVDFRCMMSITAQTVVEKALELPGIAQTAPTPRAGQA